MPMAFSIVAGSGGFSPANAEWTVTQNNIASKLMVLCFKASPPMSAAASLLT